MYQDNGDEKILPLRRICFKKYFLNQCEKKNLHYGKNNIVSIQTDPTDSSIINLIADRIKLNEWEVIFETLKAENTVKKINIFTVGKTKSYAVDENANSSLLASSCRGPVIYTRYIIEKLIKSLTRSLSRQESVCNELSLQIPLSTDYCLILGQGLINARKLEHISLSNSQIGNEGCRHLCESIKHLKKLKSLNLSNCNLGYKAIEHILKLMYSHNLQRQSATWESSFRYRAPEYEHSIGLIKLNLNNNIEIGDEGVKMLATYLIEDMWLQEIDLQNCGITNAGAFELLSMLARNKKIKIDIKSNKYVCPYVHQCISKALTSEERGNQKQVQFTEFTPLF